jgi:pSer/pThr/pTyr-binding forkhead associated (FHA) protein
MSTYQAPEWMQVPPAIFSQDEWKLDEIKNGVVVTSHNLTPLVTFGRAPVTGIENSLAILTAHESCSRLHARIAFDSQGIPWLRDLGSGNGTKVNKKSLPKKSIGKVENMRGEGSRGVILYPGDVIQFGVSTRVYLVEGPKEFERGVRKAIQQRSLVLQNKTAASTNEMRTPVNNNDIRTRDERVTENSANQELHEVAENASDIPNKYRKHYDRIGAKKYKLSNIQLEMQRIQNKASTVELSTGQTKQLENLQEREKTLLQDLSDLENCLRDSLEACGGTSAPKKRERYDDEDDVDDFFDRTNHMKRPKESVVTETEASLIARCKALFLRLKYDNANLEKKQSKMNRIEYQLRNTEKSHEDHFFIKNDLKIAIDEVKTISNVIKSAKQEIDEVEALLKVVANDKMVVDRKLMFVGKKEQHEALDGASSSTDDEMIMPPPRVLTSKSNNGCMHMPPPTSLCSHQTRGQMQPPMERISLPIDQSSACNVQVQKDRNTSASLRVECANHQPRKVKGPVRPPPGIISFISQSRKIDGVKTERKRSSCSTKSGEPKSAGSLNFDSKKDEWVAPKNQDGSGTTELNKRLGY